MDIQFGSGVVYGIPVAGNLPTNPSPFRWGVVQEATVDFKGDLKKLFGQGQFAVATARGKLEVSFKAKLAVFDVNMLNQLYFAQSISTGVTLIADQEAQTVPTTTILTLTEVATPGTDAVYSYSSFTGPAPAVGMTFVVTDFSNALNNVTGVLTAVSGGASGTVTMVATTQVDQVDAAVGTSSDVIVEVTHAADFAEDYGVQFKATGQQLTKVASGTPTAGQYKVDTATGRYTFAAADLGKAMLISYTYDVAARGSTIAISQQLMGYAPEVQVLLYNMFRGKYLALKLYDVTLGTITIPTKLEDFWIMDVDGSANADASGNVAQLMADLS